MYCVYMEELGGRNYWVQSSAIRRARWATKAMVNDMVRARHLNSQSSFCFSRPAQNRLQINDFLFFPYFMQ